MFGCSKWHPSEGPIIEKQQDQRQRDNHRLREKSQGKKEQSEEVLPPGSLFCVGCIGVERQKKKQAALPIFASRNPRDGFDMQWMDREDGRDEGALPDSPRRPPQKQE